MVGAAASARGERLALATALVPSDAMALAALLLTPDGLDHTTWLPECLLDCFCQAQ